MQVCIDKVSITIYYSGVMNKKNIKKNKNKIINKNFFFRFVVSVSHKRKVFDNSIKLALYKEQLQISGANYKYQVKNKISDFYRSHLAIGSLIVNGKDKFLRDLLFYYSLNVHSIISDFNSDFIYARFGQNGMINVRNILSKNRRQFPKYIRNKSIIPFVFHKVWITIDNKTRIMSESLVTITDRSIIKIRYDSDEYWAPFIWTNDRKNLPQKPTKDIREDLIYTYDSDFRDAYYTSSHFSAALGTDLLRWCILFEYGGIYGDNDFDIFDIRELENLHKVSSFYIPVCENCRGSNEISLFNYMFGISKLHDVALESCDLYSRSSISFNKRFVLKSEIKQSEGFFINDLSHTNAIHQYVGTGKDGLLVPHHYIVNSKIAYHFEDHIDDIFTIEIPIKIIGLDHQTNSWLYNSSNDMNRHDKYIKNYNSKTTIDHIDTNVSHLYHLIRNEVIKDDGHLSNKLLLSTLSSFASLEDLSNKNTIFTDKESLNFVHLHNKRDKYLKVANIDNLKQYYAKYWSVMHYDISNLYKGGNCILDGVDKDTSEKYFHESRFYNEPFSSYVEGCYSHYSSYDIDYSLCDSMLS